MSATDSTKLPVADGNAVKRYALGLAHKYRKQLIVIVVLHGLAAVAGLAGPILMGRLVDEVTAGTTAQFVNTVIIIGVIAVVAQAAITWYAREYAMVFGEKVFARLREEFLETATALPSSIVERSGTGDLVSRTTHDINRVQHTIRFGVPQILVSAATIVITLFAAIFASPIVALALFVSIPVMYFVGKWYLPRAPEAYIAESASYTEMYADITESVEGSRTIEALSLTEARKGQVADDIKKAIKAERRTLNLRTVLIPGMDFAFAISPVVVLVWGAWAVTQGHASVGAVTTILLYSTQLIGPVWDLVFWLDETQVAATSMARIIGIGEVENDRIAKDSAPEHERISGTGIEYAYREGHNVLHGINIDLVPGERLAVVGPSGAGKSTLGRMLAGIHPPTGGSVTVGEVPLVDLPLEDLRGHVALVTQEHHVFVGTLAQNLLLAAPDADEAALQRALRAAGAQEWANKLPEGLQTEVGSGGHTLTPAQAQQIALARLVLLDPHTLILDEATSLLDPRAARDLEQSLNAVLEGRTVVAIAHRLHTAHDADRVAVVTDGRISEIGPHHELVAAGGEYADLWHSWHGDNEDA